MLFRSLLIVGLFSAVNAATFPPPSGPFNTTLSTAKLVDKHRNDPYSPVPTPRAIMISIFRPTAPSKCEPIEVDYMEPLTAAFQDEEFGSFGIPAGTFESLKLQVCKPTVWNPSSRCSRHGSYEKYPLLLLSPGLGRTRLLYSAIAQEISSFGYIVLTMDHPYDADIVVFPDNATITAIDIDTPAQILAALKARKEDISFILNQFSRPSVIHSFIPDLPARAIDTSKVGIFGHSLGGAAAAETMLYDRRLLGGINLDGSMFGDVLEKGLHRPFMLFAHEGKNRTTDPSWETIWTKLKGWKRELEVDGSAHGTFTDLPEVVKVLGIGGGLPEEVELLLGRIDGERALDIVSTYVLAFFDRILKGKRGALLNGPSDLYPEVEFAAA